MGIAVKISFLSHLQAEILGGGNHAPLAIGFQGKLGITFEPRNPFSQFSHQMMRK
jgi:hypothetical protein